MKKQKKLSPHFSAPGIIVKILIYIKNQIISIIALFISIVSIYFSVFYRNDDLELSILDSFVDRYKSIITVDVLYNNKGNVYKSIIYNSLKLLQMDNIYVGQRLLEDGMEMNRHRVAPLIIKPGEQVFQRLVLNIRQVDSIQHSKDIKELLSSIELSERPVDIKMNIHVGISIGYLNEKGFKSDELILIGSVKLNNDTSIMKSDFKYQVFDLNDIGYIGGMKIGWSHNTPPAKLDSLN